MTAIDPQYVVILTTVDTAELADVLARALVERQLAACVNILGPLTSVYRWEGRVTTDQERLLLIKTAAGLADRVREAILELHTYDVPEVLVLPVLGGDPSYLRWLDAALVRP